MASSRVGKALRTAQGPRQAPPRGDTASRTNLVLWTVQPAAVWEQLHARGTLQVDPARVLGGKGLAVPAYAWLAQQLRGRWSSSTWQLPWWAYCKRPDLRWVRHTQRGPQVLIELAPPADRFVAFPCWAWARVFFGEYLSFTRSQQRAWENRVRAICGPRWRDERDQLPESLQRELEKSWERLFSPRLPARPWKADGIGRDREAVLPELRSEWVRHVTRFEGCRKRS